MVLADLVRVAALGGARDATGRIMGLGRGKSAKFNSRALLIEVYKKEIKRIQQFDHLMLWNPFF
jgi:hypothetical protein